MEMGKTPAQRLVHVKYTIHLTITFITLARKPIPGLIYVFWDFKCQICFNIIHTSNRNTVNGKFLCLKKWIFLDKTSRRKNIHHIQDILYFLRDKIHLVDRKISENNILRLFVRKRKELRIVSRCND